MSAEQIIRNAMGDKLVDKMIAEIRGRSFAAPTLLACAEFHENVGSCMLMGAMTLPNKKGMLADAKARSMKHYEWAKAIRRMIGCEEPWLRKTLDDAKREYKKRPAWAKQANDKLSDGGRKTHE